MCVFPILTGRLIDLFIAAGPFDALSRAIAWIRDDLPMSGRLNAALATLVAERLADESMKGILIEELSASGEVKLIAGCGLSVFMPHETMDHYLDQRVPFFFFDLLDRSLQREPVILSRREIASCNTKAALNLVVHYMQRGWDFADPHWRAVSTLGHTTYVAYHRGYQLRRAMQEDWSSIAEMYTSGGYRAVATLPLTGVTLVAPPLSDTRTLLYAEKEDLTKRAPSSTLAFVFEHISRVWV